MKKIFGMPHELRQPARAWLKMTTVRHNPAPHSLSATGKEICRFGCVRQNTAMGFIPAVHARSSTNGRQMVSSARCPSVNQGVSRGTGFSIWQVFWRLF